jgi:2,3-diketo-5-methylthio-1-phosphopentane phosphatase
VLSDFDGTVTTVDTAEWALTRFAQRDWRQFERQFEKGEITLEECLTREFSLIRTSRQQILEELESVVIFRPNFKKLAEHCKKNRIQLIIVSAGLDFVIRRFLKRNGCLELVKVFAPKTKFNANHITFTFPKLLDRSSDNFKHDTVKRYRNQKMKVVYIGDGQADFTSAEDADHPFAIEGSRLAILCKSHGTFCKEITDFQEVIDAIKEIESQKMDRQPQSQKRENRAKTAKH